MPTTDKPVAPRQRSKPTKERYRPTGPLNHNPAAVREARLVRGLLQAELAERIGRTATYVSEIETGGRDARPELLQLIAAALDVPYALLERPRERSQCSECSYTFEVRDDGRTPLHLLPDDTFCPAGQPQIAEAA
jgi:transcriptional regulator with XRE-family HTH domain